MRKIEKSSPLQWKIFWTFMAALLCLGCSNISVVFAGRTLHHHGKQNLKFYGIRLRDSKGASIVMSEEQTSYSKSFQRFFDGSSEFQAVADDPDADQEKEETWSDYLNTLFDPVFDPDASSNVSAVIGQKAHLPCRVNNLGTKTVSWIRHHDTHILTVGSFTYTGDTRFSALHREGTNEWTLQIKNPTLNDSGLYECQVSTKPVRAYLVRLDVVVPTTKILHAPDLHTNEGGVLNLTCVVSPSPAPPEYIFWYHKQEVINYEIDQRVHVNLYQEGDRTISSLVVSPASLNHSGLYSCDPSNAEIASIVVHVSKAEEPAAMQTSSGRPSIQASLFLFYPIFVIFSYLPSFHSQLLPSPLTVSSLLIFLYPISLLWSYVVCLGG